MLDYFGAFKLMKYIIAFLLLVSPCYGAELLVKAEESWNNNADTSKMTKEELTTWNARSRKGDIIVVRPDGWSWGKEECPPKFVVVKMPNVKVDDVKHYEQSLIDNTIPAPVTLIKVVTV